VGRQGRRPGAQAPGGGARHNRRRGAAQVAATTTAGRRRAQAWAAQDRVAAADVDSGRRRWAGDATRFGCEWTGRRGNIEKLIFSGPLGF
jgi:hypothetical protein